MLLRFINVTKTFRDCSDWKKSLSGVPLVKEITLRDLQIGGYFEITLPALKTCVYLERKNRVFSLQYLIRQTKLNEFVNI